DEAVIGALGAAQFVELGKAGFFERGIIIGVDDIKPDDAVASLNEAPGDVIADESGGTGDEDFHELTWGSSGIGALPSLNTSPCESKVTESSSKTFPRYPCDLN